MAPPQHTRDQTTLKLIDFLKGIAVKAKSMKYGLKLYPNLVDRINFSCLAEFYMNNV